MGDSSAHVQVRDVGDRLFAERPDYGVHNSQRSVQLLANYFEMVTKNPKLTLYVYGMNFKAFPPKDAPPSEKEIKVPEGKKLVQVVRCALNTSTFTDIKSKIATDFNKKLISCKKLDSRQMQTGEFKFWAENEIENGATKPRKNAIRFQLTLEQQRELCISDLLDNLGTGAQGRGAHADALEIVQALDTICGHNVKLSLEVATPKQGKCFPLQPTSDEKFKLEGPIGTLGYLQGVRGFFASVRATSDRILVNCNACCGAFYKPGPLVGLFAMFLSPQNPSQEQCKRLESAIQGLRVELTHLRDDERQQMPPIRTIYGLASPPRGPDVVSFYHENENKTYTVAEYWREQGYERILNHAYPVVNVGDRYRPILVPPHVLYIVPGQMAKKRLDATQTSDMIEFARRKPEEIRQSINDRAFEVLSLRDNDTLESFGVSLDTKMVNVQGRVLDKPTIIYKARSKPLQIDEVKARWNLRDQQVFETRRLRNWGILRIVRDARGLQSESAKFKATFGKFHDTLTNTLGEGYFNEPCKSWSTAVVRGDETTLKRAFVQCQEKDIRLLVIVLSDDDASTYRQIKTLGDIEYGISTVCVRGEDKKFYMFKATQYFANIALKINLKLGGINHTLRNQRPLYDTTMVIGIDVTHPSPGPTKRTAPSVAAMVASVDSQLAQWLADLRINTAGKEMVDLLGPMLSTRLELWKSKHQGLLPDNLLIYRDGVSESQYKAVLREELEALRNTCTVLYRDREQPRMTLIIVGKRHHTRFFRQGALSALNPVYGTVVDTGVTEAHNWDFFLQSHHALVGTARPAHYFVLLNEIFTREFVGQHVHISDYLQQLTYEMCYLFGRSTGPVSIPPPVYYADLACERSRCYGDFDNISDTSSMGGSGRGNYQGSQGEADLPYRSGASGSQATNRPGPSNLQNKQGPRKEDASKKQPQPTQSRTPDMMAGMTKKERARMFEKNSAASRAAAGSSKLEGNIAEAKPEAKPDAKKAEENLPEKKAGQKPGEGKAKEDAQSKAQGKKPETRAEAETQSEVKLPRGKGQVEIHPNLMNTMFYI